MASTSQPLPYTASPYRLALADFLLWVRITFVWPPQAGIPSIIFPVLPFRSGALDELYPTPANLQALLFQLILTVSQTVFLLSLPFSATFGIGFPFLPPFIGAYVPVWTTWIVVFILANRFASNLFLNGLPTRRQFFSNPTVISPDDLALHANEKWIFVNGVAAGSHWMQSNLDRLSLTFRRPIEGIHNQTRGILFDLIECVMERTFDYATPSTRMVYSRLLDVISNPRYEKIILILHSQGAIEGGLALDWLFATVSAKQLARVEVYTFGSAANHFNNPIEIGRGDENRTIDLTSRADDDNDDRVLRYIEHYANSGDYVSKFGILNFRPLPGRRNVTMHDPSTLQEVENRYVGRLFIREGTGHQLNGNYLDDFFTMNADLTRVLDSNPYMSGVLNRKLLNENDIVVVRGQTSAALKLGASGDKQEEKTSQVSVSDRTSDTAILKVKDVSRLWMYRNGMSPTN